MHRNEYTGVVFESYEHMRALHRRYFSQYVTSTVLRVVCRNITLRALLASTEESFNDIPLALWDRLVPELFSLKDALRKNGDALSQGVGVCILKEAARELVEAHRGEGAPHHITRVL